MRGETNLTGLLDGHCHARGRITCADLSRPGLIVVDAQRLFCDPHSPAFVPAWPSIHDRVHELIVAFRAASLPTLATRHVHPSADQGGLIRRFFGRLITAADPLAELEQEIQVLMDADQRVDKCRHSVFSSPQVIAALHGCDGVVLVGVQTPLCVLASAIDAARFDVVPIVVADACAARDRDDHAAALRVLSAGHAHVASAAEVLAIPALQSRA